MFSFLYIYKLHVLCRFNRIDIVQRHLRLVHDLHAFFHCPACSHVFGSASDLDAHIIAAHRIACPPVQVPAITHPIIQSEVRTAIGRRFQAYTINVGNEHDPMSYLLENMNRLISFINTTVSQFPNAKVQLMMRVKLVKPLDAQTSSPYFNSKSVPVFADVGMSNTQYHLLLDQLLSHMSIYATSGSGWIVDKLLKVEIKFTEYSPIRGSSYIPTPNYFHRNKFLLNIENVVDNLCFIYCILAVLQRPNDNAFRPSLYQSRLDQLIYKTETMPMSVSGVPGFEKANDFQINVFGFCDGQVTPLYISDRRGRRQANLLLLKDGDNAHYCLITNFNAFMKHVSLSKNTRRKGSFKGARFYCVRCLHGFQHFRQLSIHSPLCGEHKPVVINMPDSGTVLSYKNVHMEEKVPYVVYADLEAINKKVSTVAGSPDQSGSHIIERHLPWAFGAVLVRGNLQLNLILFFNFFSNVYLI